MIKTKNMVFVIHVDTWVYSKDNTMAHAHRLVVIREGSYEALYKVLMNINESGCQPYGWPRP